MYTCTHVMPCIQQHGAGYPFHSSVLQNVCLSNVVVVARDTVVKEGDAVFVLTSSLPHGRQAVPVQWPPSGSGGARTGFLEKMMFGSGSEEGIRGSEPGKREERNGTSAEGGGSETCLLSHCIKPSSCVVLRVLGLNTSVPCCMVLNLLHLQREH